jgi:hypothetical protein
MYITKGMRITARWFADTRPVGLAGAQMKLQTTLCGVSGVVRHVRGDHPTDPTQVRLYVAADDGTGTPCPTCQVREVVVDPAHVVMVDGKDVRS